MNDGSWMMQLKDRLQQLAIQRGGMMEQWEDGWEYLQLSQCSCYVPVCCIIRTCFELRSRHIIHGGTKNWAVCHFWLERCHYVVVCNFTKCRPIFKLFHWSLGSKFVIKPSLKIPPHLKHVSTLPWEMHGTFLYYIGHWCSFLCHQ